MSDRVSESEWRGEEAEAHYTTVLGLGARCSLDLELPAFSWRFVLPCFLWGCVEYWNVGLLLLTFASAIGSNANFIWFEKKEFEHRGPGASNSNSPRSTCSEEQRHPLRLPGER